ncbi:DUF4136 domain-containing protein [Dyadobacter fanqingshengii]|uniref:DUF4136 domain-containing protein n=1 Tax=Dyadobacter fanqingshengii TaxID=2906443 RepID=A0A9X1PGP5_9BACT|nr:DUF4136 domain-containing protein [Dyadobacter fanqingshengii]MCF0043403.1 DUF4136 domain-containing protein [Dyadobacter fanqingshengii]USJ35871.1 DUF4136 domain-containing protein [Dyadobacter fanqingshengii]
MLKKASLFILMAGIGMMSCSKDPISDLSTEETLVYITNHDKAANYTQYKTFSIVDSVLVVENGQAGTALTELDRDVLIRIISNMEKLGYKYVSPKSKPDIGINASWITNTYLNVVSQPLSSYYGGYWGGGGYGYGYPSYYQYYQTSESYWLISMLDFKNPNTVDKTFKVVWDAQIRGAGIGERQYVDTMVDSIFGQSGYLKIN